MKKKIIVRVLLAILVIALCTAVAIKIVNTVNHDSDLKHQTIQNPSSETKSLETAENASNSQNVNNVIAPDQTSVENSSSQVKTPATSSQAQTTSPEQPATSPKAPLSCAAGTYDAGGWCKAEPTGCPFGDSIPLDSPKCAPPSDVECNADWTICTYKGAQ